MGVSSTEEAMGELMWLDVYGGSSTDYYPRGGKCERIA